jgi:hypothetical protein
LKPRKKVHLKDHDTGWAQTKELNLYPEQEGAFTGEVSPGLRNCARDQAFEPYASVVFVAP